MIYQAAETVTNLAIPHFWDAKYMLTESSFKDAVLPAILVIVFIETGLCFPLLPGDSLLFVGGMIAGGHLADNHSTMNIGVLLPAVILVAIIGDQSGYLIGRTIGPALFDKEDSKIFKKKYISKSHEFFEKYGPKTIILGRFVPIVRTFMPVLAGASQMSYRKFLPFDIVGGVLWAGGVTILGYFLGNVDFVANNIEPIAVLIVLLSVSPAIVHVIQRRINARKGAEPAIANDSTVK